MEKEIELLKTTEKVFFVVCTDFDGLPVVQVFILVLLPFILSLLSANVVINL